jgi:hypothetical protein
MKSEQIDATNIIQLMAYVEVAIKLMYTSSKPQKPVHFTVTAKKLNTEINGPRYTSGDQKCPGNDAILKRNAIVTMAIPATVSYVMRPCAITA